MNWQKKEHRKPQGGKIRALTTAMTYEDLKGRKVLVTGSSSGIGQATAILFARQGAYVGVHYFSTKDGAQRTLKQVKKNSDGALVAGDLRDEKQARSVVEKFVEAAGGLDILVNNAGTMVDRQSFETGTLEYHEDVYATNVRSVFLVTRAALPYLKKSKGNIINIGSVAGQTGGAGGSGMYSGAKAAVATETISMAKEFAKYGIRVNSVFPGFIETRFHEQYSTPERCREVAKKTPLGRNGTGEDIANAVLFLASEAASFITGEYIAVNGGLYMRA
ncbi:MAG: SDR family oxidoreductase [Planctomycetes bacterium]|nr:SDR family oxidoreductase [Planctomycetota bacterium]